MKELIVAPYQETYRYAWEISHDSTHGKLHTDALFGFRYAPLFESDRSRELMKIAKDFGGLSSREVRFIKSLEEIPGVVSVWLTERYELAVKRGSVFRWSEICTPVIRSVNDYFDKNGVESEFLSKKVVNAGP